MRRRSVRTPRYVLTGTPGSGKTALLRALEIEGYAVVEEAATDVIAWQHALGRDEPWTDPGFVDRILTLQRRRLDASPGGPVFFDRSQACTLALSRYLGFVRSATLTDEIERIVGERTYAPTVFFVRHQGSVARTSARRITFEDALTFERIHEQTYRELGFELVDVPAGPLPDRLAVVDQALRTG